VNVNERMYSALEGHQICGTEIRSFCLFPHVLVAQNILRRWNVLDGKRVSGRAFALVQRPVCENSQFRVNLIGGPPPTDQTRARPHGRLCISRCTLLIIMPYDEQCYIHSELPNLEDEGECGSEEGDRGGSDLGGSGGGDGGSSTGRRGSSSLGSDRDGKVWNRGCQMRYEGSWRGCDSLLGPKLTGEGPARTYMSAREGPEVRTTSRRRRR
jgi:hypothetical protein